MKKLLSILIAFTLMIAGLNITSTITKNANANSVVANTTEQCITISSSSVTSTVNGTQTATTTCGASSSSTSSTNSSSKSVSSSSVVTECKTPEYVIPAIPSTLINGKCIIIVCSEGIIAATPAHCPTGSNPQAYDDCNFGPYLNGIKVDCDQIDAHIPVESSSSSKSSSSSSSSSTSQSSVVNVATTGAIVGGGNITIGNAASSSSSVLTGVKGFVASESQRAVIKTTPPTYITVTKVSMKGYTVRTGGSN
jgi:hypothetical protein